MSKRDDVKKELKKLEDENYGQGTVSGSEPDPESDDSVIDMIEDVMGEDASAQISDPQNDGFNLADEINDDEKARIDGSDIDLED